MCLTLRSHLCYRSHQFNNDCPLDNLRNVRPTWILVYRCKPIHPSQYNKNTLFHSAYLLFALVTRTLLLCSIKSFQKLSTSYPVNWSLFAMRRITIFIAKRDVPWVRRLKNCVYLFTFYHLCVMFNQNVAPSVAPSVAFLKHFQCFSTSQWEKRFRQGKLSNGKDFRRRKFPSPG